MNIPQDPLWIAAVLCLNVLISEYLVQRTVCRHLGTALLVIVVTAVTSNLQWIPASDNAVYSGVFKYVAPLAIFWLLLQVHLRTVLSAGLPMIGLFLLGSAGTVAGVLAGMWAIDGPQAIGDLYPALGAMFVGTYTGGSVNFNALALHYGVNEHGALYAGATAVDSIMTTLWMVATLVVPRFLRRWLPHSAARSPAAPPGTAPAVHNESSDTELVAPTHLSLLLGGGLAAMWVSEHAAAWLGDRGYDVPSVIALTTLALVAAQVPAVNRLRGSRLLGMFAVYVFLAVIGAFCDLRALARLGTLGPSLMLFVTVVVVVHGVMLFAGAALCRVDVDIAAVASQANIGGGTTALALARSLDRADLVLPAVLVGSLGTALGTYLGFAAAKYLL